MTERHAFIVPGISREVFQDKAVQLTSGDSDLTYYLHGHGYDPFGTLHCNERCQVVHNGQVEYVTQTDVAHPPSVG